MLEFGKSLKAAREAKNMTVSQVAERTRLMAQVVENLEKENFSNFAAPIYGRGFIKLYCSAVGLDADPYIREYMAIINGERETPIVRRKSILPPEQASAPVPEPAPEPVPEPAPEPEQAPEPAPAPTPAYDDDLPLLHAAAVTTEPAPESSSVSTNTPPPEEEPFRLEGERTTAFTRYTSPLYDNRPARKSLLQSFHLEIPLMHARVRRLAALAAAGIVVLVLLYLGIGKLYRLTMTQAPAENKAAEAVSEPPKSLPDAPTAPVQPTARKHVKVLPLYND